MREQTTEPPPGASLGLRGETPGSRPPTPTIRDYGTLPLLSRLASLSTPDLLNRAFRPLLVEPDDPRFTLAVAMNGKEQVRGWVRFHPHRMLLYRDPSDGKERLRPAALLEFPVTPEWNPGLWTVLVEHALDSGSGVTGIYLPPDCRRQIDFLEKVGFKRFASCDNERFLSELGYKGSCVLLVREETAASPSPRRELFPWVPERTLLYTTDAATAPEPCEDYWHHTIYSGYSGYPWMTRILASLASGHRRILNVPCATGDLFRLLPRRLGAELERGVGIDVTDWHVDFARERLDQPETDLVNMLLCHILWAEQTRSLPIRGAAAVEELLRFAGLTIDVGEGEDLLRQLDAAFEEMVNAGAVTDWFILSKGLGHLLSDSLPRGAAEFAYCGLLARALGLQGWERMVRAVGASDRFANERDRARLVRESVRHRVEFVQEDMFTFELDELFDLVFVWEATHIAVGVGREEDYIERLTRHLEPGGHLVLTGIRGPEGSLGHELDIARRSLLQRGFEVVTRGMRPPSSAWAYGHAQAPYFPVVVARKPY